MLISASAAGTATKAAGISSTALVCVYLDIRHLLRVCRRSVGEPRAGWFICVYARLSESLRWAQTIFRNQSTFVLMACSADLDRLRILSCDRCQDWLGVTLQLRRPNARNPCQR